jgi:hypothetical protein
MTAAARRGYVNFFVEYGGKTKRCRVTEAAVCTENLIRVDAVMESPKLAE